MANIDIDIKNYLTSSTTGNFFLLAGPCVIEGEEMALDLAEQLVKITTPLNIPLVFKGSYRKANRSRIDSFTGIGDFKALEILKKVRDTFGIPVVTDIHETHEAALAAEFVDILQIPAFLCRQTELLLAAARTGKMVNIKKGQFLAPEAMKYAVEKVRSEGNDKVCVTDRGTLFGYHDLIVDMRAFPVMKQACNCPAIADITHSLQQPNTASGVTGGQPEMIATIAKSAIAAGADGIFMETHRDPSKALSDGANMLPLDRVDDLLHRLTAIRYALG
ncbi:MAG: 3-deoxy-8-phosphooctulonate synthase [Bacteroides sp.]|nr:3-deoxy-8-phosphooctulonate synthase [Bacteroidales bacterium]MBD5295584.1 3-deoxy-8-phosphooctulonate synthase [Bacteroides sp.]MDE6235378.1 3-deoxy-8-phosphooctulonate synthase [Muribaculaceae bacterium]